MPRLEQSLPRKESFTPMMMMVARKKAEEITSIEELSNVQKVACLLISLGPGTAAELMRHFQDETEVERIALEIASMDRLRPDLLTEVLTEFYILFEAQGYLMSGGVSYAREILTDSFGDEEASRILRRLMQSLQNTPFDFFNKADPTQLASSFQNENPQLVALVLSYLKPDRAASILSLLSPELQVEIATRIAEMDRTNPEVLREVENIMEAKFSNVVTGEFSQAGGIEAVAEILNFSDRTTEKAILDSMEMRDPDMAETVRELMFVFEDVAKLDGRTIQRILREVDTKDLGLALKGANNDVRDTIFANMSERAAAMLKDDMEFMGPVRAKDVSEKQTIIVGIIRALEASGEIQVARTKDEDSFID
jgi:flagellar motor switch protein FliG